MNYRGSYDHLRAQLREAQAELADARTAIRNLAANSFGEARSIDTSDYGTHEMASQRAAYEAAHAYWTADARLGELASGLSEAVAYDDGFVAAAAADDEDDVAYADITQMLHEPLEPLKDPIAQSEWVKQGGLTELSIMPGYSVTVTAIGEDSGDIRLSILDDSNRKELVELISEALMYRTLTLSAKDDARQEKGAAFVELVRQYAIQQAVTLRKTLGQQTLPDPVDEEDPYGEHAWARSQETGLWVEGRLEKKWGKLGPRLQRDNGILVPVRATSVRFEEPSKEQLDAAVAEYSKGKERN